MSHEILEELFFVEGVSSAVIGISWYKNRTLNKEINFIKKCIEFFFKNQSLESTSKCDRDDQIFKQVLNLRFSNNLLNL